MAEANGLVYAADLVGLTIYDAFGASAPVVLGELAIPPYGRDVVVQGAFAYVLSGSGDLVTVDVSDPAHARVVSETPTAGSAEGMALAEGALVVADGSAGLSVFDLADPAAPVMAARYEASGDAYAVAAKGRSVYLSGHHGVTVIELAEPSLPTVIGSYEESYRATPQSVAVADGKVYAGADKVLEVLTFGETGELQLQGRLTTGEPIRGLTVAGGAVVAALWSSVQGLDPASLETPRVLWTLAADRPSFVGTAQSRLYVSDGRTGIRIFRFGQLEEPQLETAIRCAGYATSMVVRGGMAFVADRGMGLVVLDVSDPEHVEVVGRAETSGWAYSVALNGTYAYVGELTGDLEIIDVSLPSAPRVIGHLSDSRCTTQPPIAVHGSTAALGCGSRIDLIDVTDPSVPRLMARAEAGGTVQGLTFDGDVVVAMSSGDLDAYDVSDVEHPVRVGAYTTYAGTWLAMRSIVAADGWTFVVGRPAESEIGLLEAMETASLPGYHLPPAWLGLAAPADAITLYRDLALIVDESPAIEVVDLSEPDDPVLVARLPTEAHAFSIAADDFGGTVWVPEAENIEAALLSCPSCAGISFTATPAEIRTGGDRAEITATVRALDGDPVPAASLSGDTQLGSLGEFKDNGDGTYTAALVSGNAPGVAVVNVSVDGWACRAAATVDITCREHTSETPSDVSTWSLRPTSASIRWRRATGAVGYRVYRNGLAIADVPGAATSFVDGSASPHTDYCYSVASLDPCGGESEPSQVACTRTAGRSRRCPARLGATSATPLDDPSVRLATVVGDLAYVVSTGFEDGLDKTTLRVVEPSTGAVLSTTTLDNGPSAIAGSGNRLCIEVGDSLVLYDLSDPTSPRFMARRFLQIASGSAALLGSTLLVGTGAEVAVFDVAEGTFEQIGSLDVPGGVNDLVADPTKPWAYVGDGTLVRVVDFSSPSAPSELGRVDLGLSMSDAVVAGELGLLACSCGSTTFLIDVRDPSAPVITGSIEGYRRSFATSGQYLLMGRAPGVRVVDLSDPTAPVERWRLELHKAPTVLTAHGMDVLAGLSPEGLVVIDAGHLPELAVRTTASAGFAYDVAVHEGVGVVAAGADGVRVVDTSDPWAPVAIGDVATPGIARGVALAGSRAFVADGWAGVAVVDLEAPASPEVIGQLATPGEARAIALSDGHAFVAAGPAGLLVVDVSAPAAPTLVGSLPLPGEAWDVVLSDDRLLVADGSGGLVEVDVADPRSPSVLATFPVSGEARGVASNGQVAKVYASVSSTWSSALLDVSVTGSPTIIRYLYDDEGARPSAIMGTTLVAARDTLRVWDVGDPAHARSLAYLDAFDGYAQALTSDGQRVWVAMSNGGLASFGLACDEAAVEGER